LSTNTINILNSLYIFYCRVGDKVSYVKKGRFGVVHGSVEDKFSPYHIFVETNAKEDFQSDKIMQKASFNVKY
jgi:hypothetical protein